jgi:thiol-disulfide isomerase/thioredoxin
MRNLQLCSQRLLPALLLFAFLMSSGCMVDQDTRVLGEIDYIGSADAYLDLPTVHYKYVAPKRVPLQMQGDTPARFDQNVDIDSAQIVDLTIGDQTYPLYLVPGNSLELDIHRNDFPEVVDVAGYSRDWNQAVIAYHQDLQPLEKRMDAVNQAFLDGKSDSLVSLYQQKMVLAKQHLGQTPFRPLYLKSIGQYLVKELEFIYRSDQPMERREAQRAAIIREAKSLDFFSARSLKAQRAGIRDFATAYSETFGVKQQLEDKYGQTLTDADVRQLGYQTLDSVRTSLLEYLPSRDAKAHAKMYFIAERIGEMPLSIAEPSYRDYLDSYSDYPEYTSFLKDFYQRRKAVSPGQPAVDFALPDRNGNEVTMADFRNKYVLVDFWASWCIPCMEAIDDLQTIYKKYPQDKFEIVSISIEEDSSVWRSTLQRFDMPWTQVYGGHGVDQTTFNQYQAGGIPFYILVGPDGNIVRYNDIRPSFNLDSVLTRYIDR